MLRFIRVLVMTACAPALLAQVPVETVNWTNGVSYTYDGSGNIHRIGSDTFTYDHAGRLVQADVNGVRRVHEYDAFGNRTKCIQAPGTVGQSDCQGGIGIDTDGNRNRFALEYDAAGNVKALGGHRYSYDSVNMMTRDDFGAVAREFIYTADDQRIAIHFPGSMSRWTIRDTSGRVLREFTSDDRSTGFGGGPWAWTKDYVWRDGLLLASRHPANATMSVGFHYHLDHLGTPRRVTDDQDRTVGFHDYFAFGAEASGGRSEQPETGLKYTGHERDVWTGDPLGTLDYMRARYYGATLGRFLSVDPGRSWKPGLPQSWNRYAYVRNNPMRLIDPTGMYECVGTQKQCTAFEKARQANLTSSRASDNVKRASSAFGKLGEKDGIVVKFGPTPKGKGGTATIEMKPTATVGQDGKPLANVRAEAAVTINPDLKGNELQAAVAHEGSHISDAQKFASSFNFDGTRWNSALDLNGRQTEINAYRITAEVANLTNATFKFDGGTFRPLMPGVELDRVIDDILEKIYDPDYLVNSAFNWGMKSPE